MDLLEKQTVITDDDTDVEPASPLKRDINKYVIKTRKETRSI